MNIIGSINIMNTLRSINMKINEYYKMKKYKDEWIL